MRVVLIGLLFCFLIGATLGLLAGAFLGIGFGWIVAAVMTGFSIDMLFNPTKRDK